MTEYRGILLFAEVVVGKVDKKTLLALEKMKDLASELGVYVDAILVGTAIDDAARELISYGAKKVFAAKSEEFNAYDTQKLVALLAAIIEAKTPEAVVFADSFAARDLGPRLAQRFETSYVAQCTALGVEERERKIIQTRKAFGGKVTMRLLTTVNAPQIFSVKVDTSSEPEEVAYARGEVINLNSHGIP